MASATHFAVAGKRRCMGALTDDRATPRVAGPDFDEVQPSENVPVEPICRKTYNTDSAANRAFEPEQAKDHRQ